MFYCTGPVILPIVKKIGKLSPQRTRFVPVKRERVILKGNFLIGEGRGMNNIECDLFVCLFVKVI